MIELKTGVKGLYKIEAFRIDKDGKEIAGSRRVCADWFPNLITNNGLNLMGTSSNWLSACQVGSGTTPPNVNDTALNSRIAGTTSINSTTFGNQSSAPYFCWRRNVYRFAAGVASGNISEVGISPTATGSLFSRALIVDGSGNPTTITVLAGEVLDVAYELRMYPPTSDYIGTVTIASVVYDVVGRAANVTSSDDWLIPSSGANSSFGAVPSQQRAYNGSIGSITSSPSGTVSNSTAISTASYAANSYQRSGTVTWGLNNGNLSGGIKSFYIKAGIGSYQFEVTPAIPKDNTKTLVMEFQHSWARS